MDSSYQSCNVCWLQQVVVGRISQNVNLAKAQVWEAVCKSLYAEGLADICFAADAYKHIENLQAMAEDPRRADARDLYPCVPPRTGCAGGHGAPSLVVACAVQRRAPSDPARVHPSTRAIASAAAIPLETKLSAIRRRCHKIVFGPIPALCAPALAGAFAGALAAHGGRFFAR